MGLALFSIVHCYRPVFDLLQHAKAIIDQNYCFRNGNSLGLRETKVSNKHVASMISSCTQDVAKYNK